MATAAPCQRASFARVPASIAPESSSIAPAAASFALESSAIVLVPTSPASRPSPRPSSPPRSARLLIALGGFASVSCCLPAPTSTTRRRAAFLVEIRRRPLLTRLRDLSRRESLLERPWQFLRQQTESLANLFRAQASGALLQQFDDRFDDLRDVAQGPAPQPTAAARTHSTCARGAARRKRRIRMAAPARRCGKHILQRCAANRAQYVRRERRCDVAQSLTEGR
jgi:hypothetical protein